MQTRNIVCRLLVVLVGLALLPLGTQAQNINARRANQHARIMQGIRSGQLTHHEVSLLHHREVNIHSREMHDRMMHGGRLTAGERMRLNRSLNRTSNAIYRHKHNATVR